MVIEMNPRVSRSSALASKATGFPIAKIAARLAVGYTLQEIPNDITRATPASFEPAIDYCVVKWPRFAFEKFPGADAGSDDAHEVGRRGDGDRTHVPAGVRQGAALPRARRARGRSPTTTGSCWRSAAQPGAERFDHLLEALRRGASIEELHALPPGSTRGSCASSPRSRREGGTAFAGERTFKSVDTCAAEFAARTPYFYSSWERAGAEGSGDEVDRGDRESVVILGSGPEPDRSGDRVRLLLRARRPDGPRVGPRRGDGQLQPGDGLDRLRHLRPPLLRAADARGRARGLRDRAAARRDRPVRRPDAAEARAGPARRRRADPRHQHRGDRRRRGPRRRFGALLDSLGYKAPPYATASSPEEALARAPEVGFPLLVRPSYVLGGRAMEIVYSVDGLRDYLERVGAGDGVRQRRTIYLDRFLEDSIEVDVDALCDGEDVWIAGVMQHVEEAGIHSGDSACVLPPHALGEDMLEQIRAQTRGIALALGVVGLLNVQFAIHGKGGLHVIEANPRASRTVPFVSKAIGLPVAKLACRVMLGERGSPTSTLPADTTQRARVRQGGGAAVRPLRRVRRAARPGDALDRRGDGDRPRLPDRVRQGAGGGRGAAARRAGPCS